MQGAAQSASSVVPGLCQSRGPLARLRAARGNVSAEGVRQWTGRSRAAWPRCSRTCPTRAGRAGKRHAWALHPHAGGAALAGGARGMEAVLRWVAERREELAGELPPPRGVLPQRLHAAAGGARAGLRRAGGARAPPSCAGLPAPAGAAPARWQGAGGRRQGGARGERARGGLPPGQPVRHADGDVLRQAAVGAQDQRDHRRAGAAGRARPGAAASVTMDALLAQRALAAPLVAQGGHSLVVVKAQPADPPRGARGGVRGRLPGLAERPPGRAPHGAARGTGGWRRAPWRARRRSTTASPGPRSGRCSGAPTTRSS